MTKTENFRRLGLTLIVPLLFTSIYLTRPVLCKISNVPISKYATTERNFGTLTGDLPTFSARQLDQASDQSFIFRPWRQSNFTINVTVPVAALVIPDRGLYTPTKDVANQAIMLVFGGLTLLAMFAVPLLMTGTRPYPDDAENEIATNRKVERIMSSSRNFNYMDADLQNLIGLNPKSCLEKTVCEAHRQPEIYGLLSLPFLIMFPPLGNATKTRNISYAPYREAATKGARSFSKPCDELYHCYFDVMDLTQYFIDWYKQVMQIPPPEVDEAPSAIVISKKKKPKIRKTSKIVDPTWRSPDESQARQAFLERRIFNVSVPTFTPMFDFLLPDMGSKGSPLELTNQLIIGAFVFITYIATIFEPMLLSNARPLGLTARDADGAAAGLISSSTNRGFFSNLLGPKTIYFEDSHHNISTKLGIDPSECLQKSICQAHRHTETYGLLSSLLRLFYAAPSSSMTNATATMSPNQRAAFRGASGKTDCDDIYHCFFDPLDLTLLVFNWWKSSRDPDQMPLIL